MIYDNYDTTRRIQVTVDGINRIVITILIILLLCAAAALLAACVMGCRRSQNQKFKMQEEKIKTNNDSSKINAMMKLKSLIGSTGLEIHPIINEQNPYWNDELQLREENYFGRLSEMFIKERLLKNSGDYMISRTHDDNYRFSVMTEEREIYHLIIEKFDATYAFVNTIYPLAASVARLIRKCLHSPMNVLSAILKTNVTLRHFISANEDDSNDYNLTFLGSLQMLNKNEQVVIKVLYRYNQNELDNICRVTDAVVPVRSVRIFQSPYLMIYPFMNYGSYPEFAQRMGSRLTFTDKIEIAQTIAHVLSDMHFLGLLHCNIGARNIFVRKQMINSSKVINYHYLNDYKYYLGNFRESHIGNEFTKIKNIRWLAPEVFKTNWLTEATDVFAFGITLYEIFTTNLPYFSLSTEEIRTKLIAGYRIRPG
ncbi:Tyrosine-protein kinase transforming protein Fps [Dirofilaria immitis]|nr:Tyrosine-protein kinase transforming protein Fps [Dirofilaria immitis]